MIHTKLGEGPKKVDDPEQTLLQPDGLPKKKTVAESEN